MDSPLIDSTLDVRFARVGDEAGLEHLYGQLAPDYIGDPEAMRQALVLLQSQSTYGGVVVAAVDDLIVGTCQIVVFENLVRSPQRRAIIESVVVDAAWRHQGVGRRLLVFAVGFARSTNCAKVCIVSGHHWLEVYGFVEDLGFSHYKHGYVLNC